MPTTRSKLMMLLEEVVGILGQGGHWILGVATTPNQGGAPYLPGPITIVHSKYVVFLIIPTYRDNIPLRRAFPTPKL
jgi:hypothetical protein